jgi:hypothetical protein
VKLSEPAADAYRAIEDLKQDIIELARQRDTWIERYERAIYQLDATEVERDYWRRIAGE